MLDLERYPSIVYTKKSSHSELLGRALYDLGIENEKFVSESTLFIRPRLSVYNFLQDFQTRQNQLLIPNDLIMPQAYVLTDKGRKQVSKQSGIERVLVLKSAQKELKSVISFGRKFKPENFDSFEEAVKEDLMNYIYGGGN